MTPVNIVDMTVLKGLDTIVLTDHNACRSCPAFMMTIVEYGLLVVPDVEINASEEIHVTCLFPALEEAFGFDTCVYDRLIKFPNKEEMSGKQRIYNARDQVYVSEPNLLINATKVSFDSLWNLIRSYDGVMFLTRVDKTANNLITNLGFIPPDSCLKTAKVRDLKKPRQLKWDNPYLEQCRIINNSSTHYLEHTNEPDPTMQVKKWSAEAVVRALL